jgi:hypothetical protein
VDPPTLPRLGADLRSSVVASLSRQEGGASASHLPLNPNVSPQRHGDHRDSKSDLPHALASSPNGMPYPMVYQSIFSRSEQKHSGVQLDSGRPTPRLGVGVP